MNQAEYETLMMAHDNLQRELANIKQCMGKDKHALIKANITLNKRVQELEELAEDYKTINKGLHKRGKKVRKQNKRYRERIEYMLEEAKDHKRKGLRIQHWALIKDLEETLEESE